MAAQRMNYIQALGLGPSPSRFDLCDARHDEPEMVERAGAGVSRRAAMKRQIVASRTQVGVVRIRLPYQAHPEHARVKLRRTRDVVDTQCEMAHAAIVNHSFSCVFGP